VARRVLFDAADEFLDELGDARGIFAKERVLMMGLPDCC